MDVVFGVYLGNSSCSVAANKDNNVTIVANAGGERTTPAVVAVINDEVVTGLAAKEDLHSSGARSIMGVLRDISAKEPKRGAPSSTTCAPSWDSDGDVSYSVLTDNGHKTVQAVNVLRNIFLQMKDISKSHNTGNQCASCLCLPAWVSNRAVSITREAAKEAGFKIVAIVLQPTAACLAYNLLQDRIVARLVVTLHLGESGGVGGVVEISGGMATVRDTVTTVTSLGSTLTNKLVDYLAKEFYKKYRGDCLENKRSRQKLYNQAAKVKHILSTMPSAQLNVETLWEGVDFSTQVSRARFEILISSTLVEFLQPTLRMLERLSIKPDQIDKVVLSGGTCKIPRLQQLVAETFPSAEVLASISPDEVLAYGAAIEARAVTNKYGNTNGAPKAAVNGVAATTASSKDNKNDKKKKGRAGAVDRRKHDVMRSHQPALVSALSVPVWCKVPGCETSVCTLPRLSPPLLRYSCTIPVPQPSTDPIVSLTFYEAPQPIVEDVPDASVLAEVKIPASSETKEISIFCQLKPDGSLLVSVYEPVSKKQRKFVVSTDGEDDSSS